MKPVFIISLSCGLACLLVGCNSLQSSTSPQAPEEAKPAPLAFAWPFLEPEMMVPRGGTTRGSEVTLTAEPDPRWLKLQEAEIDSFERDRRAILAMAGNYRTSFQFTETAGFTNGYAPPRPYFSWGTEHVGIIEDEGDFISLQHTLVMYFEDESGNETGPMVMKHWRQDWTYQDTDLHTYRGNNLWARERLAQNDVEGTWTQAVFQVDDSPRYEVIGRWQHGDQFSAWHSETSHRPLPRREHSVRNDYNVLAGEHRITIAPTGWVHEQHNRKVDRQGNLDTFIAQETGLNRYQRISDPDLSAAEEIWKKTAPYWANVRDTWKKIFQANDRFQIKPEHNGRKLWEIHFSHVSEIEGSNFYDSEKWAQAANDAIHSFLNTKELIQSMKGY